MAKQDDDEDNKPRRKPIRKPRKSKLTRHEAAELLVKSALQDHLEHLAIKKMNEQKDMDMLGGIVEEYLDNFIILGYDYKGESVQLISASNQQQADALGTSIHRFLVKNSALGGGPTGPMM